MAEDRGFIGHEAPRGWRTARGVQGRPVGSQYRLKRGAPRTDLFRLSELARDVPSSCGRLGGASWEWTAASRERSPGALRVAPGGGVRARSGGPSTSSRTLRKLLASGAGYEGGPPAGKVSPTTGAGHFRRCESGGIASKAEVCGCRGSAVGLVGLRHRPDAGAQSGSFRCCFCRGNASGRIRGPGT